MTREEAIKMLTAKVECMLRETSGSVEECNSHRCGECNLCYEQGNIGEQVEYLQMAIKALEQPHGKFGKWVDAESGIPECEKSTRPWRCSVCGYRTGTSKLSIYDFCPKCGSNMRGNAE